MDAKIVTLKDIAKSAGVSVSTVSKVLNNYSDVGFETKERIMNLAKELNYTPNLIARSLIKKESRRIGLFIENYKRNGSASFSSFDIIMGFKQYMADNDYEVILITSTTEKQKKMHLSKIISINQLDGIFMMGLKFSDPYYSEIQSEDFPCVIFDFVINRNKAGSVGVNNLKGAMLAMEHLFKLGHRDIAFINGHKAAYVSSERENGYLLSHNKHDIQINKNMIIESDFTENGGRIAMETLMKRNQKITAVFAASDLMAIGAIKYLKSKGKKVPEDISVVGFDDIIISSHITPALTTIKQDRYQIGSSAAMLLVNLINGQQISNILLEPELVVRESTKKLT